MLILITRCMAVLALLLGCTRNVRAMEYRVGAQTGIAISNINYDPEIPTDWYKNGFFGLTNEFKPDSSSFSFNVELNHVQKGSSFFELNQDKIDRYRYLELPVFGRYYFFERSRFTVYAEVGASVALRLDADQIVGDGPTAVKFKISTAKRFEFELQGGVGTEYWFKPGFAAFFGARYAHGLTSIDEANAFFNKGKLIAFELFVGPKAKF